MSEWLACARTVTGLVGGLVNDGNVDVDIGIDAGVGLNAELPTQEEMRRE